VLNSELDSALYSLNLAKSKSLIKSFTYVLYQQRARHKNIQKTFIRSFFVQKSSWHTLTSETNLSHDTPPTHSYPTSEQIVRFYFFYFFFTRLITLRISAFRFVHCLMSSNSNPLNARICLVRLYLPLYLDLALRRRIISRIAWASREPNRLVFFNRFFFFTNRTGYSIRCTFATLINVIKPELYHLTAAKSS